MERQDWRRRLTQPRDLLPERFNLQPQGVGVGIGFNVGARIGHTAYGGDERSDGEQRRRGACPSERGGGGTGEARVEGGREEVERKEESVLRGGAGGHGLGFKAEAAGRRGMQSCKAANQCGAQAQIGAGYLTTYHPY